MIEEFIKELERYKEIEKENEFLKKDKKRMSEELLKLMTEKYKKESYKKRAEEYKKEWCKCCRYYGYCEISESLPLNIKEPLESEKNWIPSKRGCGKFEWS